MTSSLDDVFATALEKDSPEGRSAYLDEACRDDPALRGQVERMLAAHSKAGSFLESPALEIDATLANPAAERPGDTIGRYKLLEEIAEGGMGVVYMAEQRAPVRRKVALKIIKPGMDTREVIARFEAERQALAMMDHANIAKVFDAGETESGRSYFVMELVRGLPLTEYCDKNELTIQERLGLFVQVCQTIHHAHQKGIIHRDIKPSNVMVTHRDGTPVPKVIDFGIAKALHGSPLTERTLFTRYGQMIGTPLYMSPEQAEMSDLDIDTRSDIYSLGVMLYELLTGGTPFDLEMVKKAAFDEVRRMIREDEPPPPSTRVSTLKAEDTEVFSQRKTDPIRLGSILRRDLDWIVMKALEKDRARRYDTASDLARDVERYLAGDPVTAAPPSTRYRLSKWVRRHRKIVSTVAVFLIGGAATAGVMLAAMLIVRWRDASGREATVETSQPSTVNISKDGSVSIVPVRESEKTKAVAVDDSAFDAKKSRERQERFARESGLPLEITNSIGMKLVLIPSGEFEMGSTSDFIMDEIHAHPGDPSYNERVLHEVPRHHVRITRPFYFGVYDVTQEEYEKVMGENPSAFSPRGKLKASVAGQDTKRHPVDSVTWYDAGVFCHRLSELTAERTAGREYCLPTSAQWEYACRAGNPGRYYFSQAGKSAMRERDQRALADFAWFDEEHTPIQKSHHPVGLKLPNAWGLYDMHGNVWQWCCDCADYDRSAVNDPRGPKRDDECETRGGSFWPPAWRCRSAYRCVNRPTYRNGDLGVRVCLLATPITAGKTDAPHAKPPSTNDSVAVPYDAGRSRRLQERFAQQSGLPLEITNSMGMKLMLIPSGEFEMGSTEDFVWEEFRANYGLDSDFYHGNLPGEQPRHHVRITRPFYLGTHDVTQAEYKRVTGENPSDVPAGEGKTTEADAEGFPVDRVSRDDCCDFCQLLSALPAEKAAGRSYCLPSEAQWEYACRAGSPRRYGFSPRVGAASREDEEHALRDYAWFRDNSGGAMHAVGLKQANAWGLYDMHGNIWQWCRDGYAEDYYDRSPNDDPDGHAQSSSAVVRGGCYDTPACQCRAALRYSVPSLTWAHIGFRVCCVPGAKPGDTPPTSLKANEPVALKDFFKDMPGRWVPVLRSEKDLKECRTWSPDRDNVAFHHGIMAIDSRFDIFLWQFKNSTQGIRAKVSFTGGPKVMPYVRMRGPNSGYGAWFHSDGCIGIGISVGGKWSDLASSPPKPINGFVPIGLGANGDLLACEINGERKCSVRDRRITFGSPAIEIYGRTLLKDIEVFVPDKDSDAAAAPAEGLEGSQKAQIPTMPKLPAEK